MNWFASENVLQCTLITAVSLNAWLAVCCRASFVASHSNMASLSSGDNNSTKSLRVSHVPSPDGIVTESTSATNFPSRYHVTSAGGAAPWLRQENVTRSPSWAISGDTSRADNGGTEERARIHCYQQCDSLVTWLVLYIKNACGVYSISFLYNNG